MDALEQAARIAAEKIRAELKNELPKCVEETLKSQSMPPTLVSEKRSNLAIRGWAKQQAGIPVTDAERSAAIAAGWTGREISLELAGLWRSDGVDNVIPTRIAETFVRELDTFAAVRTVATVLSTTTMDQLVIPVVDDRSNEGALLAEESSVTMTASVDPVLSSIKLGSYTIHSQPVIVHAALLRDSAIDLEALLGTLLAERIGRKANEYFTAGTGASQPGGLLATSGGVPTLKTTASASAFTWQELIELTLKIDPAYRTRGVWMMNPATWATIVALQDANKRPLMFGSFAEGAPNRLLGYPVVENPDMPDIEADAKPIIFGDLKRFYIREQNVIKLAVLKERFVEYDAVGFLAFYYVDSKLAAAATTKAIGCLQMSNGSSSESES